MNSKNIINIMISSRNNAKFDNRPLTEIRTELKEMIEKEEIFGGKLYEVWINEYEATQSFEEKIWNKCLSEARRADIVLVLYNGQAGWVRPKDTIGICHDEVREAVESAPGKVFAIDIREGTATVKSSKQEENANQDFQQYMQQHELFQNSVKTYDELIEKVKLTLQNAITSLFKKGVLSAHRSKNNTGEALNWKFMDYEKRSASIIRALQQAIHIPEIGEKTDRYYYLTFEKKNVLIVLHAIPDALSIPKARERVGQPFLEDYKLQKSLEGENVIGPVHVIGCHKNVTDAQARNILGFPDATILKDSFGVYVADNIQKIQMIFIADCSDPSSTKSGFQQFLNWLDYTGETKSLIKRANSRKNIVLAIADER